MSSASALPDSSASLARLNRTLFSHEAEQARPGYYAVALANGVNVELSATPRCGIQRYTAVTDGTMHVLVDLGFAVNWDRPVDCGLSWDGKTLSGRRISSGWAEKQFVFFFIRVLLSTCSRHDAQFRNQCTGTAEQKAGTSPVFFHSM